MKDEKRKIKDVPKIGKKMPSGEAKKWVERYKAKYPEKYWPKVTYGWLYGCDVIQDMLKDDGCEGIWFFKGINDDGQERLVLYPAGKEGKILKEIKSLGAKGNGPQPADDGYECPPLCPDGL